MKIAIKVSKRKYPNLHELIRLKLINNCDFEVESPHNLTYLAEEYGNNSEVKIREADLLCGAKHELLKIRDKNLREVKDNDNKWN